MPISIADISEVPVPRRFTIDSPEAMREWVQEHAAGPPRFYDLYAPETAGGGLRFALGQDVAGGVMEAGIGGTGPYHWLEEGDRGPTLEIACEGATLPLPAVQALALDRLAEVLAHYVEHGERAPGRWTDARGFPLPDTSPSASATRRVALGHHTEARIERSSRSPAHSTEIEAGAEPTRTADDVADRSVAQAG